jgi:hypothetical protein
VAKTYRQITLSYGITSESIDVRLVNENIEREDLNRIRQTINGTRYEFWTGFRRRFRYVYTLTNTDVFDFFQNAYEAYRDGEDVTLEIETDDGSTENIAVIVSRPQYRDDTLGTDGKFYQSVEVELLEI